MWVGAPWYLSGWPLPPQLDRKRRQVIRQRRLEQQWRPRAWVRERDGRAVQRQARGGARWDAAVEGVPQDGVSAGL